MSQTPPPPPPADAAPPPSKRPKRLLAAALAAALSATLASIQNLRLDSPAGPLAPNAEVTIASPLIQKGNELDDPRRDGWDTEVLSDAVGRQLGRLARMLQDPAGSSPADLSEWVAPDFRCGSLRPDPRQTEYSDSALTVLRAAGGGPDAFHGPAGLIDAVKRLQEAFPGAKSVYAKFKIVGVTPSPTSTTTRIYFQASASSSVGRACVRATWTCRWTPGDASPRLTWIGVRDYEEVASVGAPWFADCTQAALGHNPSFETQLRYGMNHWVERIEISLGMNQHVASGLAVGDVDGDGREDLYLCQAGGLPNRLFVQNPDGTATDRSAEAGVDWLDYSSGALLVDFDNDGDQDLAVGTQDGVLIMSNDGRGRFTLRATLTGERNTKSLAAADFDQDGDLDLFHCSDRTIPKSMEGEPTGPAEFVYHDANTGGQSALFRNDGNWTFVEVTREVGLDVDGTRHSLAASWDDYDEDGDLDLYVANDFGPNSLFRNDGGRFRSLAREAGVDDRASGMSVCWGDYNGDGRPDLYVGNMFSSAGSRIAEQPRFKAEESAELREIYKRFAKGNTLFANAGDGTFRDTGAQARVEMGRWSWSSNFVDVNNDGWEDLAVANGYITGEDDADL